MDGTDTDKNTQLFSAICFDILQQKLTKFAYFQNLRVYQACMETREERVGGCIMAVMSWEVMPWVATVWRTIFTAWRLEGLVTEPAITIFIQVMTVIYILQPTNNGFLIAEIDIYNQLQQKERDLILAAELGKALLEKNEDLSKQNEKIAEDFSQKLEVI